MKMSLKASCLARGSQNSGNDYAYSGTISRNGGYNAYGSCGTQSGTSSAYCRLY